jgi:hypothetical protein
MSEKTRGACVFCGSELTRGGMSRHLQTCDRRREAVRAADARAGERETLLHLLVQDAASGQFWLHLEMRGAATLRKLDEYLRAVWLECCGHLSRFSLGGWGGQEMGMERRIQNVLGDGGTLTHVYDFGSSSVTLVKAVDAREGRPLSRHPVYLMARNALPVAPCQECGEPATRVCVECMEEMVDDPCLCEAHAATHPHGDYGEPLPLVNSPRLGICGYEGPAEPPY